MTRCSFRIALISLVMLTHAMLHACSCRYRLGDARRLSICLGLDLVRVSIYCLCCAVLCCRRLLPPNVPLHCPVPFLPISISSQFRPGMISDGRIDGGYVESRNDAVQISSATHSRLKGQRDVVVSRGRHRT
jgi:hypothetical protein